MAFVSIIKYEGDNSTFIWRYPERNFNTGSQLIVHESQEAIFMLNGEVLDSFGPGKHVLETENLPLIRAAMKLSTGGKSAFHAELYFVNLTEQMAIRWGTDSKISYLDPVYDFPLEIGACGEMSLSVSHAAKLLIKLVGTEKSLTRDQLTTYFRAFLMTRAKSMIPQEIQTRKISIFEVDMSMGVLSTAIQLRLAEDFSNYGIRLNSFLITTILKPDEDRNYQKFKDIYFSQKSDVMQAELQKKLKLIEQRTQAEATVIEAEAQAKKRQLEGYTYQEEKSFEIAGKIADNDAVAQFSNVGIGMGMISGVGGTISNTVSGIAAKAVGNTMNLNRQRTCISCGHELSEDAQFCSYCGSKVQTICSNCGHVLNQNENFCPQCGSKRGN